MTRAPRPSFVPSNGRRFTPYTIPDIARFRLPGPHESPLHGQQPDSPVADGPLDIPDWIQSTLDHPQSDELTTELDDIDLGIREDPPPSLDDALDVVHAILDRRADSEDSDVENGGEHVNQQSQDGAVPLDAPGVLSDANGATWAPADDPDDIYAGSEASAFENHREFDDEGMQQTKPCYDNLEEYKPDPLTMTMTEFKFALFLSEFHLSRRAWRALQEVITTSPYEELLALPKWKPTLMDKFTKQLPKCAMRRTTVKLNTAKLPNRASPVEDLVSMDMESYISRLLHSPLHKQNIYQGLAHLTRFTTEFWHTRAWGESLRTTSGQFLKNLIGEYVLPSDFVRFMCLRDECFCHRLKKFGGCCSHHLGRVTYCGLDKTGRFSDEHPVVLIAPVYEPHDLPDDEQEDQFTALVDSRPFAPGNREVEEVILVQGEELLIPAENIVEYVPEVAIDYNFDPKDEGDYNPPFAKGLIIRYIWNKLELQTVNKHVFIPARLTNPHRAELELKLKSRADWIKDFTTRPAVSLPWKLFIDAFGLYRNMYRSMTGVYPLPTFYPDHIANRRASVTPLTVGLYGMDTSDLLNELSHIDYLATGHNMTINGVDTHVVSFTICFVSDLPQQQELSGCKDHKALQPCRFCMIPKALRHDLDYNIIEFGRYHNEIMSIRESVKDMRVGRRNKKLKDFGLKEIPAVADAACKIAPGLDLLRGRPIDAAHSEFTSLVKNAQRILLDEIIVKKFHGEFIKVFQKFPVPPRFHRVQSPATHMESWRMHECMEASIIMPVLLHCWLSEAHVQSNFASALEREIGLDHDKWLFVFADLENGHIHEREFASEFNRNVSEFTPTTFPKHLLLERCNLYSSHEKIVLLFWNVARSNLLVFGRYPPQLTSLSFTNIVYRGRKSLQLLFHAAAHSCASARRARRGTDSEGDLASVMSGGTDGSSVALGSEFGDSVVNVRQIPGKAKMLAYSRLKELPNIHQGLHLWDVAQQFGACRMVNTLLGEDQHKKSKQEVLTTNHRLVSETLIQRVNTKTSIDFGFAGALEHTFSRVHGYFQDTAKQCPSLLERLEAIDNGGDDAEDDGRFRVLGDECHVRPLVAQTVKHSAVNSRDDELLKVSQPGKMSLQSEFVKLLMAAYEEDYKLLDLVNFGHKKLRWVGRVSFETRTSQRICIRVNDFVRTTRNMKLAQVDGIFTHHYHEGVERVFLVITFVQPADGERDKVLGCQIYQAGKERTIIGLPSVLPSEYWVVKDRKGSFLSLPHDIYKI
ncbi:hypothetical protein F4861DRAFT_540577 [Xylaria intraflava]|nr:hypothetical protein F4861DRAFT_540577 [Xylaria intraflava]